LPDREKQLTRDQADFLDQAVAGLAKDGKVISVRLALFAEMIKGKTWLPATLKKIGGAEGVGVTFLEETFSASSAPPKHRHHQKAARGVLKALLPESGTDIKGHLRSHSELLEASGYGSHPEDFDELLRILDTEIRLITPTDPEGKELRDEDVATVQDRPSQKYFQLTHDYMIHSLRDWLTRKQKETRRGRAELKLAERASMWQSKPERRQLPSINEWLYIGLLTTPRNWTESQRQMMRAATRKHLFGMARLTALMVFIVFGAILFRNHAREEHAAVRAQDLVRRLLDANITQVPPIINELVEYRRWTDPLLQKVLSNPNSPREHQLHAELALLPVNSGYVEDLKEKLLEADSGQFPVIRDALSPYRSNLVEELWAVLEAGPGNPNRRFRAAAALATYDPSNPRWEASRTWVVEQLAAQPSLVLFNWVNAMRPCQAMLLPALLMECRKRSTEQAAPSVFAEIISDYAAHRPEVLAEAVAYAAHHSVPSLFRRLQSDPNQAVLALTTILDQTSADRSLSPNEAASQIANLAIALSRLGRGDRLWPFLKESLNPRVRSFAIERFASLGCDPGMLLARLETEPEDSIRAGLWLGLGGFDESLLPPARRKELIPLISNVYREDRSAAVHAAVHWLLSRWGVLIDLQPEKHPSKMDSAKDRNWYINSVGQTMIRIIGPVEFLMGASADEQGRVDFERQHHARIAYCYDMGMTEITVAQYQGFLRQRIRGKGSLDNKRADSSGDLPITKVTWYDAAAFCNWLNKREGIPPDQWCYEPNADGEFADGMKIVAGYWLKTGYRLPTETEWEYACRGGAATSRCYGDIDSSLPKYAWFAGNSDEHLSPVAKLFPNAFGFFDMHGNTAEWCQNSLQPYGEAHAPVMQEELVQDADMRTVRGGSAYKAAKAVRSSKRFADRPATSDLGGFRIVRSRPAPPWQQQKDAR